MVLLAPKQGGLLKLEDAATAADQLGRQASTQRQLLFAKQSEADAAMASIQASMEAAAERRKEAELLGKQLAADEAVLQERRSEWSDLRIWRPCSVSLPVVVGV